MKIEMNKDVAQLTDEQIDTVAGGIIRGPGPCVLPRPYPVRPIPNQGDMRVNFGRPIGWVFR
jgi:hypothetical protein